jgi:uncharacterized protein
MRSISALFAACVCVLWITSCKPSRSGQHTAKTAEAAATPEQKDAACQQDDWGACKDLGVAYSKGEGVIEDKVRSRAYLKRACDGQLAEGCFLLGVSQVRNQSGPMDLVAGVASLKQACDGKYAEACFLLGTFSEGLIQMPGVQPDPRLAKQYYKLGCKYGHKDSCQAAESNF